MSGPKAQTGACPMSVRMNVDHVLRAYEQTGSAAPPMHALSAHFCDLYPSLTCAVSGVPLYQNIVLGAMPPYVLLGAASSMGYQIAF